MDQKLLAFYVLQFGALLALFFQLYGFIMTCKMFAIRNNFMLASYRSSRQSKLLRKRKHVMARQLRRNAKSVWFQKGKTDQCNANCTQNARARSKFSARAGKNCDYMRNLSPFTRAENPSPPSSRRAEIPARAGNSSYNRKLSFRKRWLERGAELAG